MTLNRNHFLVVSVLLMVVILVTTDINGWEAASISFSEYVLLFFLNELGRSIAVRELIVLTTTLTMVFSPTLVLINRPEAMILPSEEYLSYGLPATMAFSIGILLRLTNKLPSHNLLLESAKEYVNDKGKTIRLLLVVGITGNLLVYFMPVQIRALMYLLAICLFSSVLYGHYYTGKLKVITLVCALGTLLYETVSQGMFGALLHFVVLYFCVTLVSRQSVISIQKKVILLGAGALFILLVQAIKIDYRIKTWGNTISDRRSDPTLMMNLIGQRLTDPDFLFSGNHLFATYTRTNQGQLIAETINYVPSVEPYANGELLLHFIYPFIPRIIWENKPTTGGLANIERFTRIIPNGSSSSNISPLGEAYANFGRAGGILFMFFFGLLFNWCFHKLVAIAVKKPSVLFWIPSLFVGCLTLETDVLTVWGSFAIMSTFLFVFWEFCKRLKIAL